MSQSLHQLISERGFDQYRDGLEARFRAHNVSFSIHYSEGTSDPTLLVRLESDDRLGEVCVWESGNCNFTAASTEEGQFRDEHVVLESPDGFHERLAALFRYVTKRELDTRTA